MAQRWECAHLNLEERVTGHDPGAAHERPHEFLPVFETPGLQQKRSVAQRRETVT